MSKKNLQELIPVPSIQEVILPILERKGFKVNEKYWFSYHNDKNCFGRLAIITEAHVGQVEAATIFDEMIHHKYVTVYIDSLRTEAIGTPRRKIERTVKVKPKKKPVRST